jgi:hypothetical protein
MGAKLSVAPLRPAQFYVNCEMNSFLLTKALDTGQSLAPSFIKSIVKNARPVRLSSTEKGRESTCGKTYSKYIPLTLYPRRGSRGISDITPRHPRFTKIS